MAKLTINRPDRMNALALPETRDELLDALDRLEQDEGVRVVILSGSGDRAFSTGWDMNTISDYDLKQLEEVLRQNLALFFKIWDLRQPVVGAIQGYALAAGATLALVCDLLIVAENVQLGEPEIRHYALSPFLILPFLTHSKALHEYYYTGDLLNADTLQQLGLVNRVVRGEELETGAWKLAERLAKVPPYPLQMTKRSLRQAYDSMGFRTVMRQQALADALVLGADLPEQRALLDILASEGMRAFLEARDGPFLEN